MKDRRLNKKALKSTRQSCHNSFIHLKCSMGFWLDISHLQDSLWLTASPSLQSGIVACLAYFQIHSSKDLTAYPIGSKYL